MKPRKAKINLYHQHNGMYDIEAMRNDAAEYNAKLTGATIDPRYPLFAKSADGVVFDLVDWDSAIAEAEAINKAGGKPRGFSDGYTEWDARGSRNGE